MLPTPCYAVLCCAMLCRAVQDIVTASPHFSVEGFIPRLRDYLRVTNPYKRQFLISWVSAPAAAIMAAILLCCAVLCLAAALQLDLQLSASALPVLPGE